MSMSKLKLTFGCWNYDRTRALMDGSVQPDGIDLNYLNMPVEETFFRMLRHKEFDVAEMSLAKYSSLMSQGDSPFAGIPVASRLTNNSSPARSLFSIEDVGMTTFKVHVYQEAGTKTQLPGGTQSTDLIPGVGFGYYVRHEGTLSGWTADLVAAGAVALAPNLYKLHVGTAPVSLSTRIEAKAPGASPTIAGCNSWFCQWWVIALIALAGLALLILIIRAVRRP